MTEDYKIHVCFVYLMHVGFIVLLFDPLTGYYHFKDIKISKKIIALTKITKTFTC
jgi:hypothetical protein